MNRAGGRLCLVVDADIGTPAGEASHSVVGRLCYGVLRAIEEGSFDCAFDEQLRDEWREHAKGYGKTWLTRMTRSGRIKARSPLRRHELDDAIAALPAERQPAVIKDEHLVLLALDDDHRLLSRDKPARRAFAELSPCVHLLQALLWLDPELHDGLTWLAQGAPDDPALRLAAP